MVLSNMIKAFSIDPPTTTTNNSAGIGGSSSGGGVTSVVNNDSTLIISPTTGGVVASFNPGLSVWNHNPGLGFLLNGNLSAIATTVPVSVTADGGSHPNLGTVANTSGYILIDSEAIQYTSIDNTDFLTCTRGALGTTAATHSNGAVISIMILLTELNSTHPALNIWSNGTDSAIGVNQVNPQAPLDVFHTGSTPGSSILFNIGSDQGHNQFQFIDTTRTNMKFGILSGYVVVGDLNDHPNRIHTLFSNASGNYIALIDDAETQYQMSFGTINTLTTADIIFNPKGAESLRLLASNQAVQIQTASAIWSGTGVPAVSGAAGDFFFRQDGGVGTHLYFNTASGSHWVAIA